MTHCCDACKSKYICIDNKIWHTSPAEAWLNAAMLGGCNAEECYKYILSHVYNGAEILSDYKDKFDKTFSNETEEVNNKDFVVNIKDVKEKQTKNLETLGSHVTKLVTGGEKIKDDLEEDNQFEIKEELKDEPIDDTDTFNYSYETFNYALTHDNKEFKNTLQTHTGEKLYQFNSPRKTKSYSRKSLSKSYCKRYPWVLKGEKPFQCNQCNKTFSTKDVLKRHLKTHTGESPHKCSLCEKAFSTKSHLKRHLKIHTREKPYKCEKCNKNYLIKEYFMRHMKLHTTEEPHQGSSCDKTWKKPYTCHYCYKNYSSKEYLIRHMMLHTKVKFHQCNFCDKTYYTKEGFKRHMWTRHGQTVGTRNLVPRKVFSLNVL